MDVENNSTINTNINSMFNFRVQPAEVKDKSTLKAIIKKIEKIANTDLVAKAKLIDKSEAVKNILEKAGDSKCTDKEINLLRQIFYDEDDYDLEETQAESYRKSNQDPNLKKKKDFLNMAACDIIYQKAEEIKNILEDDAKKKELLKVVKENKLTKEDIKKEKNYKDEKKNSNSILTDENALAAKEWEAILENDRKNAPKINQANQKKEEPNWNNWNGNNNNNYDEEEIKNTKKNIIEAIKNKRKKKNQEVLDIADKLNENLLDLIQKIEGITQTRQDPNFRNSGENSKDIWARIERTNFENPNIQFRELLRICSNNVGKDQYNFNGVIVQIVNVISALLSKVNAICNTFSSFKSYIETENLKNVKIAQGGDKIWIDFNKRIRFNDAVNKGKVEKLNKKDWDKLSNYDKLMKKFSFKDYRQMPNHSLWKKLKVKDKVRFLDARNKYRTHRFNELAENLSKDPVKTLSDFDIFMYYQWKDSRGFECQANKTNREKYGDNKDDEIIAGDLSDNLKQYNDKKLIYNKYFFKGKIKYTNGRSIQAIKDFTANKIYFNNNQINDNNNINNNQNNKLWDNSNYYYNYYNNYNNNYRNNRNRNRRNKNYNNFNGNNNELMGKKKLREGPVNDNNQISNNNNENNNNAGNNIEIDEENDTNF